MAELKCTRYQTYDDDWEYSPCHCPVCGGFLKWASITEQPSCTKCGTELLAIPDKNEGEEMEWGKICPISERKK